MLTSTSQDSQVAKPIRIDLVIATLMSIFIGIFIGFGILSAITTHHPVAATAPVHNNSPLVSNGVPVALTIQPQLSGGQDGWPAFTTGTLKIPANSWVTVTLNNYDLGGANSPDMMKNFTYTTVQGTNNNMVLENGKPYTQLDKMAIAHTFTIPQLNVNVPIPFDAQNNADHITIQFSFKTGAPGTYQFRCMFPCGTGTSGWEGPMATDNYMQGTLIVQ